MQSHTNFIIIVILIGLASVSFAQEAVTSSEESASRMEPNAVKVPSFPYIVEITADNVYIRSGPGTNYYMCGKLNRNDRVKVVETQYSWSRIVPPAGFFSLISTQYVSIDPNNPTMGTVTGDNVRVYAGSVSERPLYSTTLQLKLNTGDKVKLTSEEEDNYYKIAPPVGAYLWVSTQYTKPLGPIGEVPLTIKPAAEPNDVTSVVPTQISSEAENLKLYYTLEKQIQAEKAKPTDQQNYTNIKKALIEIANNKQAGKAIRYAEFSIKQIECFELALAVSKEIKLQNEQLKQTKERIEKARSTRLAEFQNSGKFAAVGQFQTFETYGAGHYRIIDESKKTICYALPSGRASEMDLSKFVGLKVGLTGTVEPHLETEGALVRFTEIVELK